MRYASLLPPLLFALMVAACARQQPAYYLTDSMTGRRISTGQQAAADSRRGVLAARETQTSGYNSYASAAPQGQESRGRGLFNSDVFDSGGLRSSWFSRQTPAPTYAYQPQAPQTRAPRPYAPQTYSYQPPQHQTYAQQPVTMQYRPPAPQHYAAQQYYRPPRPQPAGYYAQRYGWY